MNDIRERLKLPAIALIVVGAANAADNVETSREYPVCDD
jgi:hypothetical protein